MEARHLRQFHIKPMTMYPLMIFAPMEAHTRRRVEDTLGEVFDNIAALEAAIDGVVWYALSDAQDLINDGDNRIASMSDRMSTHWVSFVYVKNFK